MPLIFLPFREERNFKLLKLSGAILMLVYRIVNEEKRTRDLSGRGASIYGGRWNNPGTPALYTCEHEALCLLELLVHTDEGELPSQLFILEILIAAHAPVFEWKENNLPKNWRLPEQLQIKQMGDKLLKEGNFLAFSAPSAVLPSAKNYIINPEHKDFEKMVQLKNVFRYDIDARLKK